MVYIYALINPEDSTVFYIGKANNPKRRLAYHISIPKSDGNRHKKNKIKKILRRGYRPELRILEECTRENWKDRERYWIARGIELDWPLTNLVNGGEGVTAWDAMQQIAAPYLNPTREDLVSAINDVINPVNHTAVSRSGLDTLIELGKRLSLYLFQLKST